MTHRPDDDSMIRLDQIEKRYGTVQALQPTDLAVRRGEFLTLLGPSGSGKSTLLNIIAGMTSASDGRLFIDGRDVTDAPPAKRGIGMVFQNYALMPHMTVYRNIAFPLEIRAVPKAEIKRRVDDVLALVRLPHVADRKPQELSGGQQQRISIARCMVYDPSLILMDEPLGALDKSLREQMQLEIKTLHAQSGITILYVTHDQDEALSMSDRIMLMNAGTIEQIGPPSELYGTPVSRFAAEFLGQSTMLAGEGVAHNAVRLSCGPTVTLASDVSRGTGHLMLRPECIRIASADAPAIGANVLDGILRDSLVAGGVVKHFIELVDGTRLLAQELANTERSNLALDSKVRVSWPDTTGLFLTR